MWLLCSAATLTIKNFSGQHSGHGGKPIMLCRYLGEKAHYRIMRECITRWGSAKLLGMSGLPIARKVKGSSTARQL